MKNVKRILSIVLLLSMVLSMLPAVSLTANAATYTKATSIAVGDKIVFVCEAVSMELTAISTTSTKYGIGTAYTTSPAGTMEFEVVAGYSSGTYAFKTSDGSYLYWTSGNSLNVNATLSAKTSWTVSFTEGNAFVYNASNSTRYIRWNNASNGQRFACYDSKQTDIQIYKRDAATPNTYTVSWDTSDTGSGTISATASGATLSSGDKVAENTEVTMTITPNSGFTVDSVTVNGTAHILAAEGGTITFTVTGDTNVAVTWAEESTGGAYVPVTTGQYVIAAKVGDTYYAMSNTFASYISGEAITVTDGKVVAADAENYMVTITSVGDSYTIYNGTQYLTYSSGTSLGKSTDAYTWTISEGSYGAHRITASTDTSRALVYRTSTYNRFAGYSTGNVDGTNYYDIELLPVEGSDTPPVTQYSVTWTGDTNGTISVIASGAALSSGDKVEENTEVTITITPNSGFTVDSVTVNGTVHILAAEGGTIILTVTEDTNVVVTWAEETVVPEDGYVFTKVTSTDDITTGYYLIVYETGGLIFDSSLSDLDVENNTQTVTISNNTIVTDIAYAFTIDPTEGTILSSSGYYIGKTSSSNNGINSNTSTKYTNTFSIDDSGNAVITASGGSILRFNKASDQNRFRYYGSGQQAIALYKLSSDAPVPSGYTVSWSEAGSGSGTIVSTSGDSGSTVESGTEVTMTITPDSGSTVSSVTVNGDSQEIPAEGGEITFTVTEDTTVVVTWAGESASGMTPTLKIISGSGKIEAYYGENLVGSVEGAGGTNQKLDSAVPIGETLKLLIYPGEAQRLVAIENGGERVMKSELGWDSEKNAYICEIEVKASTHVIRFSFLPRKGNTGVVAELATAFEPGKYVITGTTFDAANGANTYATADTYLLFGCDDLTSASDIGTKAGALNLYDAGITIDTEAPHLMMGLNENCLYDIQPAEGNDGYYTIEVCGTTTPYYLAWGTGKASYDANDLRMVSTIEDNALWTISIDQYGVATITNKLQSPDGEETCDRVLMFNTQNGNNQFRAYEKENMNANYHLPVLYKSTVSGYIVTYGKEGPGTVNAYNTTTSSAVASGSVQAVGSDLTFTFTPAADCELISVTVNGVDYTDQVTDNTLILENLTGTLDVQAVFEKTVISNTITVNYYVNGDVQTTNTLTLDTYQYVPDISLPVTEGTTTPTYADLAFEYSENATSGAMYESVNDTIYVENGDTINLYFLTSPVTLSKTAEETTKTATSDTIHGGDDDRSNFTDANNRDSNGNVKQTYKVTLTAQSNNWADGYTTGGNTDIILILDNSNSMYEADSNGINNRDVTVNAVNDFVDIVMANENEANNRIAIITYHTWATKYYISSATTDYDKYFISSASTIKATVESKLVKINAEEQKNGGGTNIEAALSVAEGVAALRPTDTDRDLIIIMFTDGIPTVRNNTDSSSDITYTFDHHPDDTDQMGGARTSTYEFTAAREAGLSLRETIDSYQNCDSSIYSIALLNPVDTYEVQYTEQYYAMSQYLLGAGTQARSFLDGYYSYYVLPYVLMDEYWPEATGFSDVYLPVKGGAFDAQEDLAALFASIAYTAVPGQYVSINGSIVDVIPPQFTLLGQSELEAAGWTITSGTNGTTISIPKFAANKQGNSISYEIEYKGDGYGSIYTNSSATFTFTDIHTNESVSANFYKPLVEVIPWTVNDHETAALYTDLLIDVTENDPFIELTEGGYRLENYTITLTDAQGKPTTYLDAVEQMGCKFDALLDTSNNTVSFYTETGGTFVFYYVISADLVSPDGERETVYSRVTTVDVIIPSVDLSKTAQEVSADAAYASYMDTDDYGNSRQLYLITLNVTKQNAADKVYNGVLTDVIPADFEFVAFVSPTSDTNLNYSDGTVTWEGISASDTTSTEVVTLQFLVRYTGSGYGTAYTNDNASFSYNFISSDGPNATQYFTQPVAGLNPATVNDVDIAHSGDTNTVNVLANDLYTENGFALQNYPASSTTVYITDEAGNKIDDPAQTYGLEIIVNSDGTVTYTAPQTEGVIQFYYVVEAAVTLPMNSNYAEDNSTTLVSRPTMVTVYTMTDKYVVVDFGYTTQPLSLLSQKETVIDEARGIKLGEVITFKTPVLAGAFGGASYASDDSKVSFSYTPTTTDFSATDYFATSLATDAASVYVSAERTVASGVTVIPANNLFYEESFLIYDEGWSTEGTEDTDRAQSTANAVYGYDEAYAEGEDYSGGSSKAITVTKDDFDKHAYFAFTGTGFDVYSTCSADTGVLIAEVYTYDESKDHSLGTLQRVILMDTYMDGGEGIAYDQLPVIMCRDLPYGHYAVQLRAYYNEIFDHNYKAPAKSLVRKMLNLDYDVPLEIGSMSSGADVKTTRSLPQAASGQYNVYIDSIRIYNPLNLIPADDTAKTAYGQAEEINPAFTNIRDYILDAGSWTNDQDVVNGVLYIGDIRAGELVGGDEGAIEDDKTYPAPEVDGFYITPTGTLKTQEENGKTYLINTAGEKASYNGCEIYIVYIKDNEDGTTQTLYVDDNSGEIDRIGYRYTDTDGVEKSLSYKQLEDMDIIHLTSRYEAFGPKYEVHLRNGCGIAFDVADRTSVQISAKMADEGSAELQAYYEKDGTLDWYTVKTISSRTEMYYDLTDCVYDGMLIVKCVSSNEKAILSLCNLKVSSDAATTANNGPKISKNTVIRAAFAFADKTPVVGPIAAPELKPMSAGLVLTENLAVNYAFLNSTVSKYASYWVEVYKEGAPKIVTTYSLASGNVTVQNELISKFAYTGVEAREVADTVTAIFYAMDEAGNIYVGEPYTFSVRDYCMKVIHDESQPAKTRTLAVDLLNYASEAQVYAGYKTDDLANALLTAEQKMLGTGKTPVAESCKDLGSKDAPVYAQAIGASLKSSVEITFAFNCRNYAGDVTSLTMRVKDQAGNVLSTSKLTKRGVMGMGVINNLTAIQMRDMLYIDVVDADGTVVSGTATYSIESYVYETTGTTAAAVTYAMLAYGDSAKSQQQ